MSQARLTTLPPQAARHIPQTRQTTGIVTGRRKKGHAVLATKKNAARIIWRMTVALGFNRAWWMDSSEEPLSSAPEELLEIELTFLIERGNKKLLKQIETTASMMRNEDPDEAAK